MQSLPYRRIRLIVMRQFDQNSFGRIANGGKHRKDHAEIRFTKNNPPIID